MDVLLLVICVVEAVQLYLTFTLFKNDDEQKEINEELRSKIYDNTCNINFLKAKTHDKYTKGTLDD